LNPLAALVAGTLTDAVLAEEVEVEVPDLEGEPVLVGEPVVTVLLEAPVVAVRAAVVVAVPEAVAVVRVVPVDAVPDADDGTALTGDEMTNWGV